MHGAGAGSGEWVTCHTRCPGHSIRHMNGYTPPPKQSRPHPQSPPLTSRTPSPAGGECDHVPGAVRDVHSVIAGGCSSRAGAGGGGSEGVVNTSPNEPKPTRGKVGGEIWRWAGESGWHKGGWGFSCTGSAPRLPPRHEHMQSMPTHPPTNPPPQHVHVHTFPPGKHESTQSRTPHTPTPRPAPPSPTFA